MLSVHRLCHILETVKQKLVTNKSQSKTTPEHTVARSNELTEAPPTLGRSPGHEFVKRGRIHSSHNTPVAGQALPPTALKEHSLVAQVLVVVAGPSFSNQVGVVSFRNH